MTVSRHLRTEQLHCNDSQNEGHAVETTAVETISTATADSIFLTIPELATHLKISTTGVIHAIKRAEKAGKSIPSREVLYKGTERQVRVYSLDDILNDTKLKTKLATTIAVDENGQYRNEQGLWMTIYAFWNSLSEDTKNKINRSTISRLVSQRYQSLTALNSRREAVQIYLLENLQTTLQTLQAATLQFKEDSYIDQQGIKWANIRTWKRLKRVNRKAMERGIKKVFDSLSQVPRRTGPYPDRQASNASKRQRWLYSEATIDNILDYILQAEIQVVDGIYTITENELTITYASIYILARKIHITPKNIQKKLERHNCPKLEGVDRYTGEKIIVYDLKIATAIFEDQIKVVARTDEDGKARIKHYGEYVTIRSYLELIGKNNRKDSKKFRDAVRDTSLFRLKRRDPNNHILDLYPFKELEAIATGLGFK